MSEFERSVPNSTPRSPIRQGSVPNSTGIGPQFDSSVPNSTGIGPQFDSSGSQFDSYRYLFERSVLIPSVPNSYPPVPIPGSGPWRMPSYVDTTYNNLIRRIIIILFHSSGPQFVSSGTYSGLRSLAYTVICTLLL